MGWVEAAEAAIAEAAGWEKAEAAPEAAESFSVQAEAAGWAEVGAEEAASAALEAVARAAAKGAAAWEAATGAKEKEAAAWAAKAKEAAATEAALETGWVAGAEAEETVGEEKGRHQAGSTSCLGTGMPCHQSNPVSLGSAPCFSPCCRGCS